MSSRFNMVLAVLVVAATGSSERNDPPVRGAGMPLQALSFVMNQGQWPSEVRFAAHDGALTLSVTDDGTTLGLFGAKPVTMKLVGAAPGRSSGETELATRTHFFIGNDPSRWRTNVPSFARVRTVGWRPDVAVVWHARDAQLEYDLEVGAHTDASDLELAVDGADDVFVDDAGALEILTAAGTLVQQPPRVLQGARELAARYVVRSGRVGFAVDGYRPGEALLIDPLLSYSTYLGGGNDYGRAVAVDATGAAYVTGYTASWAFPTQAPLQGTNAGGVYDAFVTKLDATGSSLVYSTYLGGKGQDQGFAIAVDASGDAYVTGYTDSTDFPLQNAYQSVNNGGSNTVAAFVTKLDSTGAALAYSTYLGGSNASDGYGIAVDASGSAYVVGITDAVDFPTQGAAQSKIGGPGSDTFITKFNAAGSTLAYSTYLGGSGEDYGWGIALDASGNAYVVGQTKSADFPTKGAFLTTAAGGWDAFVTKLNASGSALSYSTYLGGASDDEAYAIAVDGTGNAYVAGTTSSTAFPTASPVQASLAGGTDAFATKLNAAGSALVYSTFIGGKSSDFGAGIAVDALGAAYVVGSTYSTDFPTVNSSQPKSGDFDAFVTKLNPAGATYVYSSLLGGTITDMGAGVALNGAAYVAGTTSSSNFPTRNAFEPTLPGTPGAAFIAKVATIANGAACTAANECESGNCVDGVCCDQACLGQCEACDATGLVGTCTPVTGAPHGARLACQSTQSCNAVCDGKNNLACTFAPAVCLSTCTNGTETDSVCDTKGNCATPTPHSCNNLVCADASHCKVACMTGADCLSGFDCVAGQCVTGGTCIDDHTAQAADGTIKVCTPYKCATTGACGSSCTSVNDCVAPNVCDPSGQCGPVVTSNGGGCNCDVGPTRATSWAWLAALVLVALGHARKGCALRT